MKPKVIFEDKYLLILDKPAGMVVNRVKGTKRETIEDWIESNVKSQLSNVNSLRNGIVHRLDKETSGILVVAKLKSSFKNLQGQFKKREIGKEYIALVHGKVDPKKGEIELPVGRLPWNRERFGVLPGGRGAITEYEVISYHSLQTSKPKPTSDFSLLTVYPKTGRTHQIRIHMKYIGNPVVSDEFYAGRKTARSDRKWCPRLFLHASKITFIHPKLNKKVSFKSSLASDLRLALKALTKFNI
jgi:23S rRNA pseudouridine1911/1915/1917 synthase